MVFFREMARPLYAFAHNGKESTCGVGTISGLDSDLELADSTCKMGGISGLDFGSTLADSIIDSLSSSE